MANTAKKMTRRMQRFAKIKPVKAWAVMETETDIDFEYLFRSREQAEIYAERAQVIPVIIFPRPEEEREMIDAFEKPLPASLLAKIGSIIVHCDEAISSDGHHFDIVALKSLIASEDVQQFIDTLGPLVPIKRRAK